MRVTYVSFCCGLLAVFSLTTAALFAALFGAYYSMWHDLKSASASSSSPPSVPSLSMVDAVAPYRFEVDGAELTGRYVGMPVGDSYQWDLTVYDRHVSLLYGSENYSFPIKATMRKESEHLLIANITLKEALSLLPSRGPFGECEFEFAIHKRDGLVLGGAIIRDYDGSRPDLVDAFAPWNITESMLEQLGALHMLDDGIVPLLLPIQPSPGETDVVRE